MARLPQKSVLIYPLVLKDSLELVVVSSESVPIRRTFAVTRTQLNQTILSFRQALINPNRDVYALLNSGNLTKSEAFQQAQIALITGNLQLKSKNISVTVNSNFNHPYYWAPFILIGNGL